MNIKFWLKTLFLDKDSKFYKEMYINTYYTGYEKEFELCNLYNSDDNDQLLKGILKLNLKYEKINQEEYDRQLLEYNFSDMDLKKEILKLDLKYKRINSEVYDKELLVLVCEDKNELKRELLKVDLKYNNITSEQYDRELTQLLYKDYPDHKLDEEILRIDLKYNKISKVEYDKKLATLHNEPFVTIISSDYDPTQHINGLSVELDWNDKFIDVLKSNGYSGQTDYQIIDKWFDDVCRSVNQNMALENEEE